MEVPTRTLPKIIIIKLSPIYVVPVAALTTLPLLTLIRRVGIFRILQEKNISESTRSGKYE